jgi:hypothetical protein
MRCAKIKTCTQQTVLADEAAVDDSNRSDVALAPRQPKPSNDLQSSQGLVTSPSTSVRRVPSQCRWTTPFSHRG